MSSPQISKELALRIALAARALPDTDPARLLKVLDAAISLPPSEKKLAGLDLKLLKSAAEGELAEIDDDSLNEALAYLQGDKANAMQQLPKVEAYAEGDMPNSIRIACASNNTEMMDGHFGSCQRFLIYQMDEDALRLIDIRSTASVSEEGDKNANRTALIDDCHVLYVASIGGPAAAKVVKAGIHPIKHPSSVAARELLQELQQVLASAPPPWLAKAMGHKDEARVRFERSAM